MRKIALSIAAAALGITGYAATAIAGHHGGDKEKMHDDHPKPEVYIISPADGDESEGPVTVLFGLKGMGVAPAGVEKENTGHHHLLIDRDEPSKEELGETLPADDHVVHFGGGQTQTTLELKPGEHTLQLLLADHNHVPHKPAILSDQITITVLGEEDEDEDDDDGEDGDDDGEKEEGLLDRVLPF